jgi:4-amino-4-deoxy-L-arabinose transferase-like glycosyltransferase
MYLKHRKYIILFAIALTLRILYIYFPVLDYYAKIYPMSFVASEQSADAKTYVNLARGLLETGYPSKDGRLLMYSGYVFPFILAIFIKISENLSALYIFQAVLSSLICIMIAKMSESLYGKQLPGMISGYLWAFYYPAYLTISRPLTEAVFTFIFIGGIYYIIRRKNSKNPASFYLLIGLIFSAAALTRAILFYAFFIVLGVYFLYYFFEKRKIDYKILFSILGFLILQLPWTYLGYVQNNHIVIASTSGGGNLALGTYIPGNGEYADEYFKLYPDHPVNIVDKLYKENNWSDSQRDSAYMEYGRTQLLDNFRNRPVAAVKLMGYQLSRFWFNMPYIHKSGVGNIINAVITLFLLILMFAGYAAGRKKEKMISDILMILIIVFCLLHVFTVSVSRYSYPLLPIVYIFSGLAISNILEKFRTRKQKK